MTDFPEGYRAERLPPQQKQPNRDASETREEDALPNLRLLVTLAHPEDQVLILSDDPLRSNLVAKPYVWMEFYSSKGKGALIVQFVLCLVQL